MRFLTRIPALFLVVAAIAACSADSGGALRRGGNRLPAALSDSEFWGLISEMSEPGGYFHNDNFTSNEREVGSISAALTSQKRTGGVYVGVGPEQNFSYIAALKPEMAFIVDIRHQAMVQHLMYKAIFELSNDRIDFIEMLFSRPRPKEVNSAWPIADLWEKWSDVPADTALQERFRSEIIDHLTHKHEFALTPSDVSALFYVHGQFFQHGPYISTGGAPIWAREKGQADFRAMTESTGPDGAAHTFLADEESFRAVKKMHEDNLIVPITGDFAGPTALRAVGKYVASKRARVTTFYVSNVEHYLFQQHKEAAFYRNVGRLPLDRTSILIRPYALRTQPNGAYLCPIQEFLTQVGRGRVESNNDALACAK